MKIKCISIYKVLRIVWGTEKAPHYVAVAIILTITIIISTTSAASTGPLWGCPGPL